MLTKFLIFLAITPALLLTPRLSTKSSAEYASLMPGQATGQPYYGNTNVWQPNQTQNNYYPQPSSYPPQNTNTYRPNNIFTLLSNNNFCVGQTPTYTISGGPSNAPVAWMTSGPRGSTQTTFTLTNNGSFSGSGNMWQTSDIGQWVKTATINGASQSLRFSVQNCGNNYPNGYYPPASPSGFQPGSANLPGNTYYDPYNNNLFSSSPSSNSNYTLPGNTYYDPYNNTLLSSPPQSSSNYTLPGNTYYNPYNNNLLNSPQNTNTNYQAPGNTYYDPYAPVPCLDYACPRGR